MKKFKRAIFFASFLLLVGFLEPAVAQAPSITTTPPPLKSANGVYGNVEPAVPKNLHTLAQSTIIEVLSGTVCMLSGHDPLNPSGKCLGVNTKNGHIGYVNQGGGAAQVMGSLIGGTFSIPVSSTGYAQYAMDNFGITKHAYAQSKNPTGVGYDRLAPLIKIWATFRNIAYLGFVLAFTVIGLAIMFRVKIDARTVMSIQNQIPKIIIALILVTFSYAIAGLLIDLMYVITYLVLITFSSITPTHISTSASVFGVLNKVFGVGSSTGSNVAHISPVGGPLYDVGTSGIMGLSFTVAKGISSVFTSVTTDFLNSTISNLFKIPFTPFNALSLGCDTLNFGVSNFTPAGWVGHVPVIGDKLQDVPLVGNLFGGADCDFVQGFYEGVIAFVFGALAFLVVMIAILYTLFRVWFLLIKSFVYVLVDAMIGPLWITAGIFPGSKLGFTTWVRHLMGHLSVFPMTFAVILLGKTIMDAVGYGGDGTLGFTPPLVGDATGGSSTLAAIVGFGFILSIPTILEKTKKAVGAMDFGLVDIKGSLGFGAGTPIAGAQKSTNLYNRGQEYHISNYDKTTGKAEYGKKGIRKNILGIFGR